MNPDEGAVGRNGRGRVRAVLGTCLGVLLVAGCGVPGGGKARTVDPDAVPYGLLDADPSASDATNDRSVPTRGVPVVFWVSEDDHLVPAAAGGRCTEPAEDLAKRLVSLLADGPPEDARTAGRSSALPPTPGLRLVRISGGTAEVDMGPTTGISAARLPLAVGEVVLTLTSTPDIDRVVLRSSGEAVQVPGPGGAFVARAVSAEDYADLLPDRFRDRSGPPARLSPSIGCHPR